MFRTNQVSSAKADSFVKKRRFAYCFKFSKILSSFGLIFLCLACVTYIVDQNNKNLKKEILEIRDFYEHRVRRNIRRAEFATVQKSSDINLNRERRSSVDDNTILTGVSGVSYTRWGRKDCSGPNNELIYHGIVGSSYYSHSGGASNNLCLHSNVSYDDGHFLDGAQGSSRIYGMEYRDGSWINDLFDLSLTQEQQLQYNSVPCAVCLAKKRVTKVMIAGQGRCPNGWSKEYSGYIMSGSTNDKHSSEAICVDDTPQVVPGTNGLNHGAYLFMCETTCISIPCEPYVNYREIRCVVCTI